MKAILVENIPIKVREEDDPNNNWLYCGDIDGSYEIKITVTSKTLYFVCPCGCKKGSCITIRESSDPESKESVRYVWLWNGNKECPTLTPSIHKTLGCKWHGHLTNGEWLSV